MNVILYTTHCPACRAMEALLKRNNITYTECTDVNLMLSKGLKRVPWVELPDGTLYDLKGMQEYCKSKTK